MNVGFEGPRAMARTLMKEGDTLFVALSWSEHPAPTTYEDGVRAARLDRAPLAALARPRRVPRPPVAHLPAAQRADAEGALLRAHRRPGRRRHDLAAGDARRRAQLGLPLHLDPRLHVHALGPLHARLRLGGERLLLLHRRPRRGGGGTAPDHVRHRRRGRAARADARPPVGIRGSTAGPGRERRLRPEPARRLGSDPRLLLPAHEVARPPARADLADPRQAGRGRARELARARPRHLGGARRPQALHVLEADVLGRRRPRRAARRDQGGPRVRRPLAVGRRRDPRRHLRERARRPRRVHPALRHGRARRLGAPDAARALPAAGGPAHPQHRPRHRRRAHRGRPGPALQDRGDRRRPAGRGGHVHDLLVLARVGARRDRRGRSVPGSCARSSSRTRARSGSTPRRSTHARAATWGTSRRRSRTSP